jgi:cytochrome bd-type quinol oxidase subunit 2
MYVWSKRLVIGLLAAFVLVLGLFLTQGEVGEESVLKTHTTRWITLNYVGLVIWVFVWMIDQTRMRNKNVWPWLMPFVVAPLPTLMLLVLFLQRRMKPQ